MPEMDVVGRVYGAIAECFTISHICSFLLFVKEFCFFYWTYSYYCKIGGVEELSVMEWHKIPFDSVVIDMW